MSDLINEIRDMVRSDDLETTAAIRLILVAQGETIERLDDLETAVLEASDRQKRYPSATWLWVHNRRSLIAVVVLVFVLYTVILAPWYVVEMRTVLMHMIGLPSLAAP